MSAAEDSSDEVSGSPAPSGAAVSSAIDLNGSDVGRRTPPHTPTGRGSGHAARTLDEYYALSPQVPGRSQPTQLMNERLRICEELRLDISARQQAQGALRLLRGQVRTARRTRPSTSRRWEGARASCPCSTGNARWSGAPRPSRACAHLTCMRRRLSAAATARRSPAARPRSAPLGATWLRLVRSGAAWHGSGADPPTRTCPCPPPSDPHSCPCARLRDCPSACLAQRGAAAAQDEGRGEEEEVLAVRYFVNLRGVYYATLLYTAERP